MTSLFTCQPTNSQQPPKTCIFEGISPCRDHVSHLICNSHAQLFGLINKTASYHDGDNDVWTKIVTYVSASNNITIPLFINSNGTILMSDIQTFAINACNNNPNIKVDALATRISCLMGISMTSQHCNKGWFDEPNSALIIRNNSGRIEYLKELPQLHKCLFYYINASNIQNTRGGVVTYLIPNLSLTRDDSEDKYSFVIPNKKNILKYTDKPDCVATPLVLDGIREVSQSNEDRTFTPIQNNSALLC